MILIRLLEGSYNILQLASHASVLPYYAGIIPKCQGTPNYARNYASIIGVGLLPGENSVLIK